MGRNQTQGAIQMTGDPLDLAIEGNGYFTVSAPTAASRMTATARSRPTRPASW